MAWNTSLVSLGHVPSQDLAHPSASYWGRMLEKHILDAWLGSSQNKLIAEIICSNLKVKQSWRVELLSSLKTVCDFKPTYSRDKNILSQGGTKGFSCRALVVFFLLL